MMGTTVTLRTKINTPVVDDWIKIKTVHNLIIESATLSMNLSNLIIKPINKLEVKNLVSTSFKPGLLESSHNDFNTVLQWHR